MLKIFADTKKGEGGMRAFAASVALLGRTFRSELAPLARRGLGDLITENLTSNLIIPETTIKRQAEKKREQDTMWAKLGAAAEVGANLAVAPMDTAMDYVQAANDAAFEAKQAAAKLEDPKAKAERRRKGTEVSGLIRDAEDRKINDEADKVRLQNAQKLQAYQFDGLGDAEKRLAIEKEIARITKDLDHDKLANELEVQQARSRLLDLQHTLARTGEASKLPEPGQFSRMGLYQSSGAETYARIFGLQSQQLKKLDAINNSIQDIPRKLSAEQ